MKHLAAFASVLLCLVANARGQGYPGNNPGPVSRLAVTIVGNGAVVPNLNNRLLKVGTAYTVTARPAAGSVFSNWTGGVVGTDPRLTFVMQSNLVLQANFVSSPFLPVKGSYAGLIKAGSSPAHNSSGLFTGTLTESGAVLAKLLVAGRAYPLKGQFTAGGAFSNSIVRRGLNPLSVQLHISFTVGIPMTGSVSDGNFTSQVAAKRAVYSATTNPAPQGGTSYTFVLSPRETSALTPGGYGCGTLTVDAVGNIKVSGTLAEGTKFTQKTFVAADGTWPLFASLQGGNNLVLGEMKFTNDVASDLSGQLSWFKLPQPLARFYPAGFALTNALDAIGSEYWYTRGVPQLELEEGGEVIVANGDLPQNITNSFQLDANNRVSGDNRLSLKIQPRTGVFGGRVWDPDTQRFLSFNGVLLQTDNAGFGFFANGTQTGSVFVGATNAFGLPGNTNHPPVGPLPSRILDLANWKLTLPEDTLRRGSPDEILQPDLDKFRDPNYFFVNRRSDGVVFTAPCGGATTGGSDYPRSELREMENYGRTETSWSTTSGTHAMEITEAITHLPIVKPHVVAGQIHGANDDVIVFRLEGSELFVDENGNRGPMLNADYRLGEKFTVKFVVQNGGVAVYCNGKYIYTHPVTASGCYFKAGCYTQSNTSRGDAPTAFGQVVIYKLSVTHQ